MRFLVFLNNFVTDFCNFVGKFTKTFTKIYIFYDFVIFQKMTKCYVLKFRFRIVEFVWRSPKVLWSLSGLKFGHTFWIFTNRKISLFWYDFVKELFKNSSYRSTNPLNEIVAQNSHTTPPPYQRAGKEVLLLCGALRAQCQYEET